MQKKCKRIMTALLCAAVLAGTITLPAEASFANTAVSYGNIQIDGYFDDWTDKPSSYEFNWDNSASCWYWGMWGSGLPYQPYYTEEGTYDNHVRHDMSLYCDGENVYLYIQYASIYGDSISGYDYQFWINGRQAVFQVELPYGYANSVSSVGWFEPGIYDLTVRHRNSSISYQEVLGAEAKIYINETKRNSQVEIKIPLSSMKQQNHSIRLEDIKSIEFFCPNLMYRSIRVNGTSTAPYLGIAASMVPVAGFYFLRRRKKNAGVEK